MQTKNALYIEILSGNYAGNHFTVIDEEEIVIGAVEECRVCVPEQTVSGRHCQIVYRDHEYWIKDLDSTNGTYLNDTIIGKRGEQNLVLRERRLASDDKVSLGKNIILAVSILSETETQIARFDRRLKGRCLIRGYRNGEILGKGGMGSVRKVFKNVTGESFALKTMMTHSCLGDDAGKRFLREMNITQALNHEHIVRVFQTGIVNEKAYILMEYCEGGSLMDLMKRRGGKLPIENATEIMLQILDGLAYLHEHQLGLVHRDIKPGNILLSDRSDHPVVKISDFGMAKAYDQAGFTRFTKTGMAAGTAAFIPKQQISFKDAGPEVDLWAATATYYYMLTGMYPKYYAKDVRSYEMIQNEMAIPIRERNPAIARALAQVIDRALREEPELYYKSALQLKNDIMRSL